MIRIPCPWCGPRNVSEFRHHGETTKRPDPTSTTESEWRRYLYFRKNSNGWVEESWYHSAGCRRFFRIRRNTTTNEMTAAGSVQ
jgi:heterotetrameric sarcosine oxidase delta subunit